MIHSFRSQPFFIPPNCNGYKYHFDSCFVPSEMIIRHAVLAVDFDIKYGTVDDSELAAMLEIELRDNLGALLLMSGQQIYCASRARFGFVDHNVVWLKHNLRQCMSFEIEIPSEHYRHHCEFTVTFSEPPPFTTPYYTELYLFCERLRRDTARNVR